MLAGSQGSDATAFQQMLKSQGLRQRQPYRDFGPLTVKGLKRSARPSFASGDDLHHQCGRGATSLAAQDHQDPRQLPQRRCGGR
jgi:hypothetical protein